jgi:hypothetical protein
MSCAEKGEERRDTKKPPVLVGPKGRGAIPPAKEAEAIHPFAIRDGAVVDGDFEGGQSLEWSCVTLRLVECPFGAEAREVSAHKE